LGKVRVRYSCIELSYSGPSPKIFTRVKIWEVALAPFPAAPLPHRHDNATGRQHAFSAGCVSVAAARGLPQSI